MSRFELLKLPGLIIRFSSPGQAGLRSGEFRLLLDIGIWMSIVGWCILMMFTSSDPFYGRVYQTLVRTLIPLQSSTLHESTLLCVRHEG